MLSTEGLAVAGLTGGKLCRHRFLQEPECGVSRAVCPFPELGALGSSHHYPPAHKRVGRAAAMES